MQEDIENKSVHLAISGTKLTARTIAKGLALWYRHHKNKKAIKTAEKPSGKQSVKKLIGQNQGVSSMPIGQTGLGDFQRIARKYGVDFAVVKDKTAQPMKYTVFFKARDADAISQVLNEYSKKQMRKAAHPKPSVLKTLKKFKDLVASIPKKVAEKKKEQTR